MVKLLMFAAFLLYVQDTRATEEAWTAACVLSDYGCEGVMPPVVLHLPLGPDTDGKYRSGAFVVQISDRLEVGSPYYRQVVVHEFVHYLQMYGHYSKPMSYCEKEEEAWYVGNLYAAVIDHPELIRYNWRWGYPRCSLEEDHEQDN